MDPTGDGEPGLETRIAALERAVAGIEARLASPPTRRAGVDHEAIRRRREDAATRRREFRARALADPGQWLNRLGIVLLLFGVAFGFKYSIDQGWLGPAVRVASGLALGGGLLVIASRLRGSRPGLSRLLGGGGITSWYLSMYASFQLYAIVPHSTAFAGMAVVTGTALILAFRERDALMAAFGTAGGFATPFLLYTGTGNVPGLVGYTCVVLVGASAVYARRGWRLLLWTAAAGGWLVLWVAGSQVEMDTTGDAISVQAGLVFLALATWGLAVGYELLSAARPETWPPTRLGLGAAADTREDAATWTLQPHQLALATPLLFLAVTGIAWDLDGDQSGAVALALAAGWAATGFALRGSTAASARQLAETHGLAAAVLLAYALARMLGDEARLVALAVEALALHALATRSKSQQPAILAHALFVLVSLWSLVRLVELVVEATPGAGHSADLLVIAVLVAAALLQSGTLRVAYAVTAQVGLLLWLQGVLDPFDNGVVWVTGTWFANAVALVVLGLRRDSSVLRQAGGAVMALTVLKLFVFDMAEIDAVWRIATFLAFGAILLGLGYAFPNLWKKKNLDPGPDPS